MLVAATAIVINGDGLRGGTSGLADMAAKQQFVDLIRLLGGA